MVPTDDRAYFRALDGLRGLAAVAVALFHWLLSFSGFLAVDFFIVLSGFILAHRYLYADTPVSGRTFVVSRIARLYPMHLFGLVSYAIVYIFIVKDIPRYPDGTLFTFLQQLTLTHNIGLNTHSLTWNAPSWSISVEFWLNLIFFCCIRRNTSSIFLLLMSIAGLMVIYNLTGHIDTTHQNYFQVVNSGLLRGWSSFVLGIIAYRAWREARRIKWPPLLVFCVEAGLCLLVGALFFALDWSMRPVEIFAPPVFAVVVFVFALEQGLMARLVQKLQWLGTISYSIYLNHLIVLMLVNSGLGHLGYSSYQLAPFYLCAVLAYSVVTYRWIEVPGKHLIKHLEISAVRLSRSHEDKSDDLLAGKDNGTGDAGNDSTSFQLK